jgi:hypothetical protein
MAKIATQQQISKHLHRVLQQYTEAKTMRVFDEFVEAIAEKSGMELFEQATAQFPQACGRLIAEFQVLAMMNHPECSHFLIQQISLMFERLFNFFTTSVAGHALVYSVIASVFSEKDIPQIFEQLARLDHDSPLQSLQEKTEADCKSVVRACLTRFVAFRRQLSDRFLAEAMARTDWIAIADPPAGVSPAVAQFCADLAALSSEVLALIGLTHPVEPNDPDIGAWRSKILRPSAYASSAIAPTFVGLRDEGIHHIDRLFMSVNRLRLSRALEFDVQSIMGAIVMYAMKTLLEFVRLGCFSSNGFNQIQVDAYFLYAAFNEKIGEQDAELFAGLVEEIVSSAADRTVDPVPLDVARLTEIAGGARFA